MTARARQPLFSASTAELVFCILALLLIGDAFNLFLYGFEGATITDDRTESNALRMYSALAVYCVAGFLVLRRPAEPLRLLALRPELILLALLPIASAFWSFDPPTILRRSIAHALTIVFCLYLVSRYTPEQFLRRLMIVFFVGGAASIFLCVAFPQLGVEQGAINTGSWQGVYGHKATLGRVTVMAAIASLLWRPSAPWEQTMRWAVLAMSIFLAAMSQSRAAWAMLGLALAFIAVLGVLRNNRLSIGLRWVIALALSAAAIGFALAVTSEVLGMMDRDLTFSGRTKLWAAALDVAGDKHALFGTGYRAFWIGPEANEVRGYLPAWGRVPFHGHNGYLDLWLELGWVGVGLFALFVALSVAALMACLTRFPQQRAWLVFSTYFFLFLANNASVSVALKHTDISWVFAVCAALYAVQALTAPAGAHAAARGQVRTAPAYTLVRRTTRTDGAG